MKIKNENSFKPAPKGVSNGICVDIVDQGIVTGMYGAKHKVRLVWEIDRLIPDGPKAGKRFLVMKSYTANIGPKSTLRKDLESWRGKEYTKEEAEEIDLDKVLGVCAQLLVIHNDKGDTVYANVAAVLPAVEKMTACGEYKRVKDREGYQAPSMATTQDEPHQESPSDSEGNPF